MSGIEAQLARYSVMDDYKDIASDLWDASAKIERLYRALQRIESHLCVLEGQVCETEKRDHKWEGMYEQVKSWRALAKDALK